MILLKKFLFAPFFIVSFLGFCFLLKLVLKDTGILLSLEISSLINLIIISGLAFVSSLFFVLFATLTQDWKYTLAIGAIAALAPFIFLPLDLAVILGVLLLVSLSYTYFFLDKKLHSYVTFQPTVLLAPSVKFLASLILIAASVVFYLLNTSEINKNGFQIPESVIDSVVKLTPQAQTLEGNSDLEQLSITPEQINILKENPELAKQYGLSENALDALLHPATAPENPIKGIIKQQTEQFLAPYANLIPIFLTLLFFLTLHSFLYIFSLLTVPLVWGIFYLLEKTNFVHFELEMREIKKMVV